MTADKNQKNSALGLSATTKQHALWTPSADDVANSRLTAFTNWINDTRHLTLQNYEQLHAWSVNSPEAFWDCIWDFFGILGDKNTSDEAAGSIVTDLYKMPGANWFAESKLNFAENLLRYAQNTSAEANKTAIVERNENGRVANYSFRDIAVKAAYLAYFLKEHGVVEGDRVAAVSTNSHHAIVGMLATASLGAVWSSCSPDFGESGILDRFAQIEPKVLLACANYQYAGKRIDCEGKIQNVVKSLDSLTACVLFDPSSSSNSVPHKPSTTNLSSPTNQLHNWESMIVDGQKALGDEPTMHYKRVAFNAPLYILFSSGTTGKPKCIVHGVGGTLLQHLKELALHTDVKTGTSLFYFTTCGWMMWNWYVSGLALGAKLIAYDGSPFHPEQTALFDLAEQEDVEVFGVSAKFFAAAEKFGLTPKTTHNLSALRSTLSTGSPLAPESFDYLYRDVAPNVRVSSISGGTDIVSCFALGNPNLPVFKGELQCIGLGMDVSFQNDETNHQDTPITGKGELVCKTSFPSMPIYFWGDGTGEKYHQAYFASYPNQWAHGDYGELISHQLNDGSKQFGVVIHGRSDATLNPNGVRIGTAELYRQVEKVDAVFESLAVGQQWQGDERIILFVKLKEGISLTESLVDEIKATIRRNTSPRHVPSKVIAVDDIPRTRSGKIVELAVRSIIHGEEVKNTEALANPEALDLFRDLSREVLND